MVQTMTAAGKIKGAGANTYSDEEIIAAIRDVDDAITPLEDQRRALNEAIKKECRKLKDHGISRVYFDFARRVHRIEEEDAKEAAQRDIRLCFQAFGGQGNLFPDGVTVSAARKATVDSLDETIAENEAELSDAEAAQLRREGREASDMGKGMDACPFERGSERFLAWETGFFLGQKANADKMAAKAAKKTAPVH